MTLKGRAAARIPADATRRKRERQVPGSATPAKILKSSNQAFSSDCNFDLSSCTTLQPDFISDTTDQAATVTCNSGYSDRQLAPSPAPSLAPRLAPSLAPRLAPSLALSPSPSPLYWNIGDLSQLQALIAPNLPAHPGTANFVRAIFAFALDCLTGIIIFRLTAWTPAEVIALVQAAHPPVAVAPPMATPIEALQQLAAILANFMKH